MELSVFHDKVSGLLPVELQHVDDTIYQAISAISATAPAGKEPPSKTNFYRNLTSTINRAVDSVVGSAPSKPVEVVVSGAEDWLVFKVQKCNNRRSSCWAKVLAGRQLLAAGAAVPLGLQQLLNACKVNYHKGQMYRDETPTLRITREGGAPVEHKLPPRSHARK